MSHIVDAHVAYIKAIADLSRDKVELLERIKRLEEMYEGVIGEKPELLGSNVMGLLKRELNAANQRIKRLDEENNELRAEEARLLNTKGELERRIKRFMDAGDAMFPWSERVGQEFWNKAKEDKL